MTTHQGLFHGTADNQSESVEIVKNYTYDANGNTLSKETGGQIDDEVVKYTYDSWNRLSQFEDADGNIYQYAYNGNNERVSKITDSETTKFYWDRGYISNESTDGVLSASNTIGVQGIFARTKDNNEEYLLKDGHGSVTDLLSNGTVTDEFEYDAYGNEKTNTANDNPFRYSGEYYDEESGLIYLRNRYYDPSIGRFITEDPIQDELNWYAYCGNNPINFVDPWGFKPGDIFKNLDEAAIDAANYLLPKTHENDEEMIALIYHTTGGYQYYETTNIDPNPTYAFRVRWNITPEALVHTHVYYEVEHENNILSNPNNTTGTDGSSDTDFTETTGVIIYGAMPTGELRKYSKGDNEIEGTIISTELVVDPKYNVYQQLKNTLIWPLLVTQYASTGVKDEDEQFKMDIVKAKVKHPSSLYNVLKEVDIIK